LQELEALDGIIGTQEVDAEALHVGLQQLRMLLVVVNDKYFRHACIILPVSRRSAPRFGRETI
jgi:hypothetical protein